MIRQKISPSNHRLLRSLAFAAGMLGLSSSYAHASDGCDDVTTQTALNVCSAKAFRTADANLQRVYDNYKRRLSAADRRALTKSQRLWVQFKEQDCKFVASKYAGGSLYSFTLNECLLDRTQHRLQELQSMANPAR